MPVLEVKDSKMVHELAFGDLQVFYTIQYSERKTLSISVNPDCTVTVIAPNNTNLEKVHEKVKKRLRWITKQQGFFQQFSPRAITRKYVGGETHFYLGRRYRLKLITSSIEKVRVFGAHIFIQTQDKDNHDNIQNLLMKWYRIKAYEKFNLLYRDCWKQFNQTKLTEPRLSIRILKRRWGSLSSAGLLTLNIDLIRSPKDCIQYVIMHELCHLQYRNHTPEFYKLLTKHLPDWEKRKNKLEATLA